MRILLITLFLFTPLTVCFAKDVRFEEFFNKTITVSEIKEYAHKYGVRQEKLDMYRASHPLYNFPKDIKDLEEKQAKQILNYLYKDYRFDDYKYDEIQEKVWDMFLKIDFKKLEKNINECISKYYNFGKYYDGQDKNTPNFYAPFGSMASVDLLNGIKPENIPIFLKLLNEVKY